MARGSGVVPLPDHCPFKTGKRSPLLGSRFHSQILESTVRDVHETIEIVFTQQLRGNARGNNRDSSLCLSTVGSVAPSLLLKKVGEGSLRCWGASQGDWTLPSLPRGCQSLLPPVFALPSSFPPPEEKNKNKKH